MLETDVPDFVYESFYPRDWREGQYDDLAKTLDDEPQQIDVALLAGSPVGWVCTRLHPEDRMGEVYVLAVDPRHQRQSIGNALLEHSFERIRRADMNMVMVETGDDRGHAPARSAYDAAGFERWPVARYFKGLTPLTPSPTP
ncbi:GNAT family N-acetyltransferase [Brevibacterium siliguriense]|uniref:GNAT family N-acetyltransferase n=1 Tax=Brevibacterium siliguriense TaxID=1136497 RepID=UPI001E379966|nr:GNAT family N-acetyltransferase [Brevibacterium siliguriense]